MSFYSELVRLKPNIETSVGDSTPTEVGAIHELPEELPLIEVGFLEFDKAKYKADSPDELSALWSIKQD